jgi:hypothetical protein
MRRSILKPVSLTALSVHARSIRVAEIGVALRPEGAAGVVKSTTTVLDQAESPMPFVARIR